MSGKQLRITPEVLERLEFFTNGPVLFEEVGKTACAFYGVLYGISIKELSEYPIVLNCSGNAIFEGEKVDKTVVNLEFLSEIFPVGLEPVGVVYLTSDENDTQEADILSLIVESLPENSSILHDPVVVTKKGKKPLVTSINSEGEFRKVEYISTPTSIINEYVTLIRLRGKLELFSVASEKDIVSWIRHTIEKVSCPYGSFKLDKSNVLFLHSFAPSQKKATGWIATEVFKEEYTEECKVTNLESLDPNLTPSELAEKFTVKDLWSLIQDEEDEDDGFGVVDVKKKNKKAPKIGQTLNFKLLMKMSGDACTTKTRNCAPVIHYEKKPDKIARIPLFVDGLALAPNDMKIEDLMDLLKGCIQRQVHILGGSVLSEFSKLGSLSKPEVFHMKPKPFGHFISLVYTQTGTCSTFAPFRLKMHRKFLMKPDAPYFRKENKFVFDIEKPLSGPLTNVHEGLPSSGVNGEVAIVDGIYSYHHYMQDNFDDDGWGCAYRSLQTLISWFRHQGYAATPIPTHQEIQKCLVEMGDKEKSFIGSKQWIGSTEVGYVLQKSCNVECKFLSLSSGEDMENKGRELAHHFKTNGTPIMIGGGVLAHTILGVDWDEAGNIAWLILDPHYTGSDWTNDKKPNLSHIQSKGWVGWKKPGFWDKKAFYNLCMPQRPLMY